MKSSVLAAIILVGAAGGAWAADVSAPRPAVKAAVVAPAKYDWTGLYIGGNVGYGWAREDGLDLSGVIGGGLVGFNWQSGMFVGGIEADYQWSDQKESQTGLVFGIPVTVTARISSFATVRGRAGVAVDNVYIYGTGGYAYFEAKVEASALGVTVSETATRSGWTAGAGIDVALVGNLIARGEYLYLRPSDSDLTDNVVRGALIYKFGGGPAY